MDTAPVLECSHLRKMFAAQVAIDDFSFEVEPGTICGLLGPNGAGKTSLIRMILDIFRPDSGTISIFGGPNTQAARDRIGYLPEERGLYRRARILDVLEYLAALKNVPTSRSRPFIRQQLQRVGLGSHLHKKTSELSKGMLQKVQIIASFVHQPALLILDEPFSGLDPLNVQVVLDLIAEQRERGVTILLSTHQMDIAERLCDKLVMVNQGRRVLYGTMDTVRAEHATNRVRLSGPESLPPMPGSAVPHLLKERDWEIECGDQSPQALLRHLVDQGVEMRAFTVREPTLHEIFLKLAQAEQAA
ncbi:MAG: ABC transporter ATP-binding protein [Candidatus Xenobia bacterium]